MDDAELVDRVALAIFAANYEGYVEQHNKGDALLWLRLDWEHEKQLDNTETYRRQARSAIAACKGGPLWFEQ